MSISLQNLASIQPRTSSPKFAEASKRYPPPVINLALAKLHVYPAGKLGNFANMERCICTRYCLAIEKRGSTLNPSSIQNVSDQTECTGRVGICECTVNLTMSVAPMATGSPSPSAIQLSPNGCS